jgi:uncharacterized protein YoaH (UPF0181 family)
MNEQFHNAPDDVRANIVLPKQKNWKVVAISDPVYYNDNTDEEYEKRIAKHIEFLNKQSAVLERDKNSLALEMEELMRKKEPVVYDGQRIYRLFHSLNNRHNQATIQLFEEFYRTEGNYYVFDIETFGDSQDRHHPYGVSEIAINEYDKEGNLVRKTYNTIIQQDQKLIDYFQKRINQLRKDKYLYNSLEEWEKRSLVDFMRYASYMDEHDTNAFSFNPETQEIKHHSIIQSVFDHKDRVDHRKVLREMEHYLTYMQSGLDYIKAHGAKEKTALEIVAKLIQENSDKFFISYNGMVFDVPVLKAAMEKHGITMPKDMKHLDFLNVIKTAFSDSDELKRKVNPNYKRSELGKNKLAAMYEPLNTMPAESDIDVREAHNSQVDTDITAKVVAGYQGYIHEEIANTKIPIREGFSYHPTYLTWNDEPLRHGQILFANGGVMAYREGDESFRVALNEDGEWVKVSNGFNKTVINSKTFYEFAGVQELEEGKLAFRFYDPDRNEYAYIVRNGENAFQELQDFVQSRFYNWDNLDPKLKEEIRHVIDTDRARRRYQRFFSMDGGGKGLTVINGQVVEKGTAGFSGLKRMLANAEVMKAHLESKGAAYREKVKQLMAEGMSRNQAKKTARKIRAHQLPASLDFNSLWDEQRQQYVFNKAEKEQFFKMYKRLIDELPYLKQAVETIDAAFTEEIQAAAQIQDAKKRRRALININQKRDQALMSYYQNVINIVGEPEQERSLKEFENRHLLYFDPEAEDDRRLNFETVKSAQNSLYSYAKRGVQEGPNRKRVMKERLNNLIENLYSQGKISKAQRSHYADVLWNTDSVWDAAGEIAIHMRQRSGDKYETSIKEPSMIHNKNIKQLDKTINQQLIQQAITDTQNAILQIQMDAVEGKKLVLGEEMRKTLEILDEQRFSRLNPKNYEALEELITSIRKADKTKQIAIVMDTAAEDANLKIYVYDGKNSIAVRNQLNRGTVPAQALEINIPLINKRGLHQVGNLALIGHSIAVREGKDINLISSAQYIARGYADRMEYIMRTFNEGDVEKANKLARRTLRNQIENMSGTMKNSGYWGENDTYVPAYNQADTLKESHVKLSNAMVEDFFYNGYDGIQLAESDFYDPDDVFIDDGNGNRVLRKGVTLDDVKMETSYKMLMKMPKWAEERLGIPLSTSSLKAEHVSKAILSMEEMRELVPYGMFYNHGRDNLVQYHNAYFINEETEERLKSIKGVSRDPLLKTERQWNYEKIHGNRVSINMKVAYMTQDELRDRIEQMANEEKGRTLLKELQLLDENEKLLYEKLPRLYEQQGIIAKDVLDAMKVDHEKRYAKGKQFKLAEGLKLGSTIKPGQILGYRTHDNGYQEEVRYEGDKVAQIVGGIDGDQDLRVRWQSTPFKLMLDGEKMTDSPVDRRFIEYITGRDDIVAIINPDVAKHRDFGMLMSGEARLLSEYAKSIRKKSQRDSFIATVHNQNIGLQWNDEMGGFIDRSYQLEMESRANGGKGFDIRREQFEELFAKLRKKGFKITAITNKDVRFGILEAHMSRVANYSKVTDHTGKKVIGYEEGYNAATGEYEVRRVYATGADGVQWGHREMGVLKSYGLEETYKYVHGIMMKQAEETGRLHEARAVAESLKYMTQDERIQVEALSTGDFESLPELYRNKNTYRGTIFDREKVESLVERYGNNIANEHGFWLALPSVERADGKLDKITVRLDDTGKMKEIDKIFIPFTRLEGDTAGNIQMRDLQRHIARIYEKAEEVYQAKNIEEARAAHQELKWAVRDYVKQSFKELTSSKGILFGDAFKASMATSASGLFKLMDFETSQKVMEKWGEGEYTIISEETAKKMGIYDQLKAGKELYAANVRYPTFHDGAMQFTRLRMADWVKEGEFHTTSFASMLQNADSDGDYSHIVVIEDDKIQKEWKKAHDQTREKFAAQWAEHQNKAAKRAQPVSIRDTMAKAIPEEQQRTFIPKQPVHTDEQMASKIGKMTIGRASNLNLFIRQIADRYYADNADINYKMKEFGRALEQKLIDAKHGAEPAGLKMIDAIYAGQWDRAFEIDDQYFEGMFQKDYYMRDVAQEMPTALTHMRNGLHTAGFKLGTSTGINANYGIQNLIDLLYGQADPSEYGGDNKALAMWHQYLQGEGFNIDISQHPDAPGPIRRLTQTPMRERVEAGKGKLNRVRNAASDFIGGKISNVRGKVSQLFDSIQGMSAKKAALLGAGLAVAGIAGYNILSSKKPEMYYNNEEIPSESKNKESKREPKPALQVSTDDYAAAQNATINIEASGKKVGSDQMSHMVAQGMRDAGMNAGPTRISVTQRDNTQQLNRIWYRDKVRENI